MTIQNSYQFRKTDFQAIKLSNEPELKKELSDVEYNVTLEHIFRFFQHNTLTAENPIVFYKNEKPIIKARQIFISNFNHLINFFGFPYTSGECGAVWTMTCNVDFRLTNNERFTFIGISIDDDIILITQKEQIENEPIEYNYYNIGKYYQFREEV